MQSKYSIKSEVLEAEKPALMEKLTLRKFLEAEVEEKFVAEASLEGMTDSFKLHDRCP